MWCHPAARCAMSVWAHDPRVRTLTLVEGLVDADGAERGIFRLEDRRMLRQPHHPKDLLVMRCQPCNQEALLGLARLSQQADDNGDPRAIEVLYPREVQQDVLGAPLAG